MADQLIIRGAREHNLKDVSLDLPRDSLIVFTGLSGSGKSSLAFDTIFAEGQRRYVESLSAYARQFLGQMDKPDVDFIEGLSPAVSIDQKSTSKNPRSTVGTITEVYDYLRLLYARAGRPHCPVCGAPIERQTPQQIVDRIMTLDEGTRFQVLAPVIRGRKGEYVELFRQLQTQGFSRARVNGETHQLDRPAEARQAEEAHDRGRRRPARGQGQSSKRRLTDSVETALEPRGGPGHLRLRRPARPKDPGRELKFSREDGLPQRPPDRHRRARAAVVLVQLAVRRLPRVPRPRHPDGGRPRAGGPRPRRHPRRGRASSRGAAPTSPTTSSGCSRRSATSSASTWTRPWEELPDRGPQGDPRAATRPRSTSGTRNRYGRERSYYTSFEGVVPTSSAATARPSPTPAASGSRASCARCRARPARAAGSSRFDGGDDRRPEHRRGLRDADQRDRRLPARPRPLARASARSPSGCSRRSRSGSASCSTSASTTSRSTGPRARCPAARRSGSGSPPRSAPGWSASSTSSTSRRIGLHQRDNHRLIETLVRLKDLGNTLIVVEHDEDTIRTADWVVDIGPGAGEHGGQVVHSRHGARSCSSTPTR